MKNFPSSENEDLNINETIELLNNNDNIISYRVDGNIIHESNLSSDLYSIFTSSCDIIFENNKCFVDISFPKNDDNNDKICRICHDDSNSNTLIAPCCCSGSIKFVHTECLNTWRGTSTNRTNLLKCSMCNQAYVLNKNNISEEQANQLYKYKVLKDILLVIGTIVLLLLLAEILAFIINYFWFPLSNYISTDWSNGYKRILYDSILGIALFFAIFGIISICIAIFVCCVHIFCIDNNNPASRDPFLRCYLCYICFAPPPPHYSNRSSSSCCTGIGATGCDCGGCGDCGGGDCGGGDCGEAAIVILIILLVLIIIIGIIAFIAFLVLIFSAIAKRHLYILEQKSLSTIYDVMDLSDPTIFTV